MRRGLWEYIIGQRNNVDERFVGVMIVGCGSSTKIREGGGWQGVTYAGALHLRGGYGCGDLSI